MKKIFLGLAILAFALPTTFAQEAPVEIQVPVPVVTIPTCKPTFKQVVELLSDYSLVHQEVISGGEYWGLTVPARRHIFISDEPIQAIRETAVLHELIHACYNTRPIHMPKEIEEEVTQQQAAEMYEELFK